MRINWEDNSSTVELLTSPDPYDRIIGKIYHTLQDIPKHQRQNYGDRLLLEEAPEYIANQVSNTLMDQFVGQVITPDTISRVNKIANELVSHHPGITAIVSGIPNSTDIQINLTLKK